MSKLRGACESEGMACVSAESGFLLSAFLRLSRVRLGGVHKCHKFHKLT